MACEAHEGQDFPQPMTGEYTNAADPHGRGFIPAVADGTCRVEAKVRCPHRTHLQYVLLATKFHAMGEAFPAETLIAWTSNGHGIYYY